MQSKHSLIRDVTNLYTLSHFNEKAQIQIGLPASTKFTYAIRLFFTAWPKLMNAGINEVFYWLFGPNKSERFNVTKASQVLKKGVLVHAM